ncbi:PAS domain-containing protein [Arsenicibacter rosenii]|uniref:histidine kinase n=1 Tax=Arsenicibacter rosenii TaxID=1750698 RepID=A0A1S2VME8_9BACT|nr:PAS domain-containing protein [Arsenicibacter rosenii]OIN59947.1 hypothetical protein BLX24_08915 [Arsenicibacter rosenii]
MTGINQPNHMDMATANERFELLAKATRDAVWDWNLETNTVWWNDGFNDLFGYAVDTLPLGPESWSDHIHPDDREGILTSIHDVIDVGGSNWSGEYRFRRADGSYAYVFDRGYIMHRDGKSIRMVGSMQDITSVRELSRQREAEQEKYRLALMASGLGTWDYNLQTDELIWDDRCRELFGVLPGAPVTWDLFVNGLHPEDRPMALEAVSNALTGIDGGQYDIEYRTVGLHDGQERWVRATGKAYFRKNGKAFRFIGTVENLTEQKQKDLRLRASEERFKTVIEQAPVAMLVLKGPDMVFDTVNESMLSLIDKTPDIIGKPMLDVLPEITGQAVTGIMEKVYTSGEPHYAWEILVSLNRNGRLEDAYFNVAYTPMRQNGVITGIIEVAAEVTEQVKARIALEKSEQRFRTFIEEAPFAIGVYVTEDIIIENSNKVLLNMWSKDTSVIGKPMEEAIPELKGQPFIDLLKNVYRTGITYDAIEQQAVLLDNGDLKEFWFNFTYKPLKNEKGEVYAILHMAVDVSAQVKARQQLKKAEEDLRKAQQNLERQVEQQTSELRTANLDLKRSNDSLQQFAYVASHDLQEPLRKIQAFGSLLQEQYARELGESGYDMLRRMQHASERMSLLIKDLLAYSRISTHTQTSHPVDLNKVMEKVLDTLEWQIGDSAAKLTFAALPMVQGDSLQLSQLFQNLLSNAIKFRKPGEPPVVTVTSEKVAEEHLPPVIHPPRKTEYYYRISVADNGIGFDNKYLDRIFEVFQRLHGKSTYEGTGIGLAICQKVVANHGGAITARSEAGHGATFDVYLPVY